MNYIFAICLSVPIMGILCWKDCRERRLPNAYTLSLAVLGVAWRLWADGIGGLLDGVLGGVAGALFLIIPFLMKAAGGGDVKMLAAAGIFTGLRLCIAELFFVSICGLLLGVFMLLTKFVSAARLKHFFRLIFDFRYDRYKAQETIPSRTDERGRVPFGVAIAIGTVATLLYAGWLEVWHG